MEPFLLLILCVAVGQVTIPKEVIVASYYPKGNDNSNNNFMRLVVRILWSNECHCCMLKV